MLLRTFKACFISIIVLFCFSAASLAVEPSVDYSDAPQSYGLAWQTGDVPAAHSTNGFFEWLGVDISPDSAPPQVDADTYDDGVTWDPMVAGQNANVSITGTLNEFICSEEVNIETWIDFNGNGQFDQNEKAIDWYGTIYSEGAITYCGVDPSLVPTIINHSINIPADSVSGNTWMRVRLWWNDTNDDLVGDEEDASPTGEKMYGEVEDYSITIQEPDQQPYENHLPVANAGGPYTINEGQDLSLNGSATDIDEPLGDSITSYRWDLDNDGQFDDAIGKNPTIAWADVASYAGFPANVAFTVRLQVIDSNNGTSSNDASAQVNIVKKNGVDISLKVSPNKVKPGSESLLHGQIKDSASNPIKNVNLDIFQLASGSSTWQQLATVQVNESGEFNLKVNPTVTTRYKAVFNGDSTNNAGQSNEVVLSVYNLKTLSDISMLKADIKKINKKIAKLKKDIKRQRFRLKKVNKAKKVRIKKMIKKLNKNIISLRKRKLSILKRIKRLEQLQLMLP